MFTVYTTVYLTFLKFKVLLKWFCTLMNMNKLALHWPFNSLFASETHIASTSCIWIFKTKTFTTIRIKNCKIQQHKNHFPIFNNNLVVEEKTRKKALKSEMKIAAKLKYQTLNPFTLTKFGYRIILFLYYLHFPSFCVCDNAFKLNFRYSKLLICY